jgi:hypothetical protein
LTRASEPRPIYTLLARADARQCSAWLASEITGCARANGAKSLSPGWTVCLRPSGLWFGRRSCLWHQEPDNRDSKQAYRCHTQKCCRPIKVRGDEPKECSAAFTELHLAEIASLTVRYRVPAINWSRSFAENGGLISYGLYLVDEYRRGATYVDRVLKGEKPSQLPVQAPVKLEFVINLKTAKALGLTVPQTLLVAADELIE